MSIVKNNLSPLPFFTSLEDRTKWYGYGHKNPLIADEYLLPFIIRRNHKEPEIETEITDDFSDVWESEHISRLGQVDYMPYLDNDTQVYTYDVTGFAKVKITTTIPPLEYDRAVLFDTGEVYGAGIDDEVVDYDEEIEVPGGATLMYVVKTNNPNQDPPTVIATSVERDLWSLMAINESGEESQLSTEGLALKTEGDYDYIYTESDSASPYGLDEGLYYLVFSDGENTMYSAWISVCNDTEGCLEINWHNEDAMALGDFYIPAGSEFVNRLIFDSELCYPEYIYEDEVISRDGYEYPTKNISYKKYKFVVLGQEEICDVMRLIHLSDNVKIYSQGKEYDATSFNMNVEWLEGGFLAKISCEFTTDTVVKKLAKKI